MSSIVINLHENIQRNRCHKSEADVQFFATIEIIVVFKVRILFALPVNEVVLCARQSYIYCRLTTFH